MTKISYGTYVKTVFSGKPIDQDDLSQDDKLILLRDLRSIDEAVKLSARTKLFHGYVRLAIKIATEYTKRSRDKDDIIEEALLSLWILTNKLVNLEHDNMTGYLIVSIHNAMKDYFKKLNRRKLDYYAIAKDIGINDNEHDLLENQEIKRRIVKTSQERVILDLRLQGYNNQEIADVFGCSREYIRKLLSGIGKRYDKYGYI